MKNFVMKLSRLKLLLLFAFVCLTCAITIAEMGVESAIEPAAEPPLAAEPAPAVEPPPAAEPPLAAEPAPAVEPPPAAEPPLATEPPLAAEPAPAAKPAPELPAEPNAEQPAGQMTLPLKERMQKRISVEFRNTAIEDALMLMADQADVDIVKSPAVTGNVTVKLTDVPLEEALDNILAAHGYRYVADKSMIRVAPANEIEQVAERIVSRIYRITYADIKEVESALKKFISKQGSLSSSPGTSNIIVTDTEGQIKAIDSFIEEVDRITPQVLVEARVYDITSTEGFDIGTEWHMSRNIPLTDVTEENTYKKVDTLTSPKQYTDTETKYEWDDTLPGWVIDTDNSERTVYNTPALRGYEVTDTEEITKESSKTWWKDDTGQYIPYRKSKPFVGGSFDKDSGGTIRLGFLDMVDMELQLNILRTTVGAKLLANPRILVLDNETAEFKIISEIPYTERSSTEQGGQMTAIKFKEVGVELKVTPHVTRDGMVRLHIVPEFGVVTEAGEILESGTQTVPTVDTRKVDTKALVRDGQTVVIGGLRKREVSQDISKVPFLGDIPILGNLFMSVSEEVETNELIIFITPNIVIEPTLSPNESKGLKATEFGGPHVIYTGNEKAEQSEE